MAKPPYVTVKKSPTYNISYLIQEKLLTLQISAFAALEEKEKVVPTMLNATKKQEAAELMSSKLFNSSESAASEP